MIRTLKHILGLRSFLALVLMFWCAGTGCMMVSYARAAAADLSSAAGMMDHAMAGSMSTDAHACCKAKRSATKGHRQHADSKPLSTELNLLTMPSTPAPAGVMNCCPLTTGSIVVSSRSQSNDSATVLQQRNSSSHSLISSHPAPLAIPLRLPNRTHSYLLDCAFLI